MELYHLIHRGIDGRKIFMDNQDRARFVHDLYEFNDTQPAQEYVRAVGSAPVAQVPHVGRTTSHMRERLVDIHGWKLMDNHTHLLVSERIENALTLFTKKLGGYARYFNERHERRGPLFENGTKKILIKEEPHALYILHYIHLNGLDDFSGAKGWRERDKGTVKDVSAALEHLKRDRWSSYRDYCGIPNFPSILTKTLHEERCGEYVGELAAYLSDRSDESIDPRTLE